MPIFVMFSAWQAGTNKPVQCGRESTYKSRVASGNTTLSDCTWRAQHLQGGEHQWGLGKVSCCGLCRAKTSRRCICACANILSMPMFCGRSDFVDTEILSMPMFCWRQYFVNANILLMHYFVDATIMLTPIFCQRLDFFDANGLSLPRFCRRQYFVNANVLSTSMFYHRQYFAATNILSALRFKDDYLLNILLMIVFCVYHDYY